MCLNNSDTPTTGIRRRFKPDAPMGYFLAGAFALVLLLAAFFCTGCVSIPVHEQAKTDEFLRGQRTAYQQILYFSKTNSLSETRWLCKSALDALDGK